MRTDRIWMTGSSQAVRIAHGISCKEGNSDWDMLIAGHALSKNMPIVTHHLRALKRVSGLQIEDWLE